MVVASASVDGGGRTAVEDGRRFQRCAAESCRRGPCVGVKRVETWSAAVLELVADAVGSGGGGGGRATR